ncbi:hypothetical protein baBA2_000932 (plasmid) [Borrelia anserina]|uniref:Uncharacterized protein n=1 Tax=Borrelia anserina Es TaxID=1365188 RepID=A0ABM6FVA5_BORAN|nr:hypothetical protein [Borrelia anserina]APR65338.1 hypothetical protein N187_A19 [Borrelia anserina Es]UPA07306.1 hypothetical protein baBA2_000932 [Borrelia anserina]
MNENNPAFDELKKVLLGFKQELEDERSAFSPKEAQLNIRFKGVLNEIFYPSDLEEVYEALGYDVEVIRSLGRVFDHLNFRYLGDRDTRIVANLLNGLMHVSHSIETLFENLFNKTKLEMLRFRDVSDLEKITQYLVRFRDAVKDLVPKITDVIISAASKTTEDDILKELNRIISGPDARLNRGMRNIHYILFDIIELVDLL